MRGVLRPLEHGAQGLVLGAALGLSVTALEYLALARALAFADHVAAYRAMAWPHVALAALAGVLVGVAVALVGPRASRAAVLARIAGGLVGLAAFGYGAVWATYLLGRPLLKLSNLLAYAGAAVLGAALAALLAWLLGTALRRLDRPERPWALRATAPLALVAVLALGLVLPRAFAPGSDLVPSAAADLQATARAEHRPNIVFIIVDTLRADHLSLYGYSRETDPNIKALAARGMTFTRMYAQASSTRPSVATVFTSLYPAVHKANEDRDFLSGSFPVLAERLRSAGYQTFGLSANANVSPTFGYARGFDEFLVWKTESPFRLTMLGKLAEDLLPNRRLNRLLGEHSDIVPDAASMTDVALRWAAQRSAAPAFMFIQYIDPHDPYRPPAPYDAAFDHRTDPPRRRPGTIDPLQLVSGTPRGDVARILDLYDGEIRYADHHVGRLLDGLRQHGMLDNAIVLLTSDHGEEFWEHANEGHGRSVYEEVMRVPFVIAWPGKIPPGTTHDGVVGLIDLMPTLLGLLRLEPPSLVQGTSFAPVLTAPGTALPPRQLFGQVFQKGFGIEMVLDGRHKLIRHAYGPRAGHEEFYDLEQDPLERTSRPETFQAARLRKELATFNTVVSHAASLTAPERVKQLDKDTERALRSLGYIK